MNAALQARRTALFASTGTATLIDSLRTLDAIEKRDQEETMVRAWTIDELEQRYPNASAIVQAAFEAAEEELVRTGTYPELPYVAILTEAIEKEIG
jgi:hypothetical protein